MVLADVLKMRGGPIHQPGGLIALPRLPLGEALHQRMDCVAPTPGLGHQIPARYKILQNCLRPARRHGEEGLVPGKYGPGQETSDEHRLGSGDIQP